MCIRDRFNVGRIQCKVLIEAAQGCTSWLADFVLNKKNIFIMPDLLTTNGSITASYFEWLRNLEHVRSGLMMKKWTEKGAYLLTKKAAQVFGKRVEDLTDEDIQSLKGPREHEITILAIEESLHTALRETLDLSESAKVNLRTCLLYTSPSPRDRQKSRMPSSA
eukprot:TRINITY_DN521_c0_g1_i12.p2 TRINITY_DN521_c0_g1~~TRINITY_DN521_c0_g1_i12.p2  ORF type:complete len:164 (-),score=46.13 TRINITY_DN521_c0_g1_i12:26-517(-)